MHCLETTGLEHRYSQHETILDDLNMQVPEGSIYGFLGANGSGKTTTLKLALGLLKVQRGMIHIFGKPFQHNRIAILQNIGSLIGTPSIYEHLTAYENLHLLQKVYGCPKQNIADALKAVDLSAAGKKKAGQFSLGMKQRLGIAIALLHKPAMLILDEPTNGLDPNGIIEMRELLQKLNHENGTTIIISSHLLAEVEKLVTHVGILARHRLVFEGSIRALQEKQQQLLSIILDTSDADTTAQVVARHGISAHTEHGKIVLPAIPKTLIAGINHDLVHAGVSVYEIKGIKNDLESIFMNLISA
jgi:lantibiotic transport system ATP-binding protein